MLEVTWCPGCGNFGIWQALKNALGNLSLSAKDAVVVFDIGCNSNMFNWLEMTSFESLHGRTLPVASGIKIINPKLSVLAVAGDGGCYGEGGNHLLHAAKRNLDLTLLVHNNQVYALTTGQTSPTSAKGFKSKSTPAGSFDLALNPLAVAISAGASFVARGFAGDLPHLTDLMTQAVKHKGFAIIDILQPCVSFNNVNTFDWFRQRIYKMEQKPADKLAALEKALEFPQNGTDAKIPIGIFFQEEREVFQPETVEAKPEIERLSAEFL